MKRLYWMIIGIVVVVVVTVLFVPGVAESIEGRLLGLVAGWAS